MRTMWAINQGLFTTTGALLGTYLGGADGPLLALVAFVVADYVTGILRAGKERCLSSKVGFAGIARKITIFILVGLANLIDHYALGEAGIIRTATIFFYISNEGISMLENTAALGLPVPAPLREALAVLRDKTTTVTTVKEASDAAES